MLYCVNPEHEVFNKRYRYRRPATAVQVDHMAHIANENGFFDDLPELSMNELKQRQLRLPKKVRQQLQLEKLRAQKEQAEERLARHQ